MEEACGIIDCLKKKNSVGMDGLPIRILKINKYSLRKPLVHISNCMFTQGIFPNKMKVGVIVHVHKKGDPLSPDNYRPVKLLNTT